MATYEKKPILGDNIWCETPTNIDNPEDIKIGEGWVYGEIPTHLTFNWGGNLISTFLAHVNLYGIPHWDAETIYPPNAYVTYWEDDVSRSQRLIFVSTKQTQGEKPVLSSTTWRQYSNTVESLRDVDYVNNTPSLDDILYFDDNSGRIPNPLYSDEPVIKLWRNKPQTGILAANDLKNVMIPSKNPQNGAMFTSIYMAQETGGGSELTWVPGPTSSILPFLELTDFNDVNIVSPVYDDILKYQSSEWGNRSTISDNPEVQWDEIFFKPSYYRPYDTNDLTDGKDGFGGIRYKFSNLNGINDLQLFSTDLPRPDKPNNCNATKDLSTGIDITWNITNDNNLTGFDLFKDGIVITSIDYVQGTYDYNYTDTSVNDGEVYYYYIKSYYLNGETKYYSYPSNSDSGIKIVDITTSKPTGLTASQNISSEYIYLDWDKLYGAISYNLQAEINGNWETIAFRIHPPFYYKTIPNQVLTFRVQGYNNSSNYSEWSDTAVGKTLARPGEIHFNFTGSTQTFQAPNGVSKLDIFMIGAGGSGATAKDPNQNAGGGFAGEYKKFTIDISENEEFNIYVGSGKSADPIDMVNVIDGVQGESTTFQSADLGSNPPLYTALGGKGGFKDAISYRGMGGYLISDIYREFILYDGMHSLRPGLVSCYGGQASPFGNGGSRSGQIAGPGAGGSAVSTYWDDSGTIKWETYDAPAMNRGGHGAVVIRWGINIPDENPFDNNGTITINTKIDIDKYGWDGKIRNSKDLKKMEISENVKIPLRSQKKYPYVTAKPIDPNGDIYDINNYSENDEITEIVLIDQLELKRKEK